MAARRILLTGTPVLNRPVELWPQLEVLDNTIFKSMTAFGKRYCAAHRGAFGMDYTGASNLAELHLLLEHTVMIRRLKNEVLQLPPKHRHQVTPFAVAISFNIQGCN